MIILYTGATVLALCLTATICNLQLAYLIETITEQELCTGVLFKNVPWKKKKKKADLTRTFLQLCRFRGTVCSRATKLKLPQLTAFWFLRPVLLKVSWSACLTPCFPANPVFVSENGPVLNTLWNTGGSVFLVFCWQHREHFIRISYRPTEAEGLQNCDVVNTIHCAAW